MIITNKLTESNLPDLLKGRRPPKKLPMVEGYAKELEYIISRHDKREAALFRKRLYRRLGKGEVHPADMSKVLGLCWRAGHYAYGRQI